MKTISSTVLAALVAASITAASPEQEIKKAYFAAADSPLTKAGLPTVIAALNGDKSVVVEPTAAAPAATKAPKTPKAPATPKEPKVAETGSAALARLKADPATSAKWARVQSVDEMGKRGPTVITIVCDDRGPNGETLTRQIKVQDLFQVKFSRGYAKKQARRKTPTPAPTA